MRLKKFNELVNYHELLTFIHDNLSYLLDDFTVNINDDSRYDVSNGRGNFYETYQIWIKPKTYAPKWEDIKLDFIPFFGIIS